MRKHFSLLLTGVVAAGLLLAIPAPATAVTAGIPVSADALPTWQTNSRVFALAASGGKIVAGGNFTQISPGSGQSGSAQAVTGLAIFNAKSGQPDSCQLPATYSAGTAVIYAAAAAPDGKSVFVGGNFSKIGSTSVSRLAEIDVINCKVLPFRVSSISSYVYSIAVTSDSVYIGGTFQNVAGQPRQSYAKLNRSGTLQSWTANAVGDMLVRPEPGVECRTVPDGVTQGRAIAVNGDGSRVVLGGSFYTVNGVNTHSIAVVDAQTGAVVQAYPADPNNWYDPNNVIHPCSITKAIVSDGTNFYIGNEGSGGGVFDGSAAFSWSSYGRVWTDTCLGATQALLNYQSVLFQANHHHDCASMGEQTDGRRIYLTVTNTSDPTQRELGWLPELNDGVGEGLGPRAFAMDTTTAGGPYLWVGGEFTRVNGTVQQSLTHFSPVDTGAPATPTLAVRAISPNAVQVNIRSVVDADDMDLTYSVFRGTNTTTPVWTGVARSQWWYRPQLTFVDTNVSPGTNYSYRVQVSDPAGNKSALSSAQNVTASATASGYASTVLADTPALYYRYDDVTGSVWVIDSSGQTVKGLNGIAQNGVDRTAGGAIAGDGSRSATFTDGSGQYVYNDQIAYGPTTYSIETWFKTTSTSGGVLVNYGNGRPRSDSGVDVLSSNYDRTVYMEQGTGRLRFGIYSNGVQSLRTDRAYNDGAWHHTVATQGPSGMRLYVDGVLVGRNSVSANQQYYGEWHVGGDNLNGWPNNGGDNNDASRFFDGQLDETAVYGYALTANQDVAHYRAGGGQVTVNDSPTDAYGAAVFADGPDSYWRFDEGSGSTAKDSSWVGSRTGTIGSSVTRTTGVSGGAVTTPGTDTPDSLVASPQVTVSPNGYSVELWVKTGTTSGGKIIGAENIASGSGANYDKHLYMLNDGRLRFGVYTGSTQVATSSASYNDNNWHYVVATQDASTGVKLYVDGQVVGTNSATTSESGDRYWRIGGGNLGGWPDRPSSDYFQGSVDEVGLYSAVLSADSVAQHYGLGIQDTTAPTVPSGLAVSSAGELTWSASSDNTAVAGYRIYRGATADFAVSASTRVADVSNRSWTDTDTTPGVRYYRVTAYDGAGNESAASSAVSRTVSDTTAPSKPTGVQSTVAGRDVSLSWNASSDNVGVDHYVVYRGTSAATLTQIAQTGSAGYVDTGLANGTWYYAISAVDAVGNASAQSDTVSSTVSVDSTAPGQTPGLTATGSQDGTVALTWGAASDDVGVTGYRVFRGTTAAFTADETSAIANVTTRSFGDTGRTPGTWYYRVAAYDAAGNLGSASDAASAVVTAAPSDTTAPSTPQNVAASGSGSTVQVTWTASTDNVGVAGYRVYRGTAATFTPGAGNLVGTVTSGTSFSQTGVGTGTSYYKVIAFDAAGNASAASAAASVTLGQATVVTVPVGEDTMVAQNNASAVYGTNNQLSSRTLSGSTLESYLRFAIPTAPAGTTLTGATLRVYSSTDSTATSTGAHQIRLISGAWSAATTTWSNKTTTLGASIGELSGVSKLNTAYTITLDANQLAAAISNGSLDLALATASDDNLRIWSNEASVASTRPVLLLTYTPNP